MSTVIQVQFIFAYHMSCHISLWKNPKASPWGSWAFCYVKTYLPKLLRHPETPLDWPQSRNKKQLGILLVYSSFLLLSLQANSYTFGVAPWFSKCIAQTFVTNLCEICFSACSLSTMWSFLREEDGWQMLCQHLVVLLQNWTYCMANQSPTSKTTWIWQVPVGFCNLALNHHLSFGWSNPKTKTWDNW